MNDMSESQLATIYSALGWQGGTYWQAVDEIRRLVSIAKAAERDAKDAARYRWLRDKALSAPEPCPWVVYGSDGNNADLIYGAELDAAIDAALIPPGCKPT